MSSTSASLRATIAHLAANAFQHHRLRRDGDHWLCRSSSSGNYWFGLYAAPGMIVLWGDIGECVLRHSDHDSLGWLAGAAGRVAYPDYCLGKIAALDGAKREFFPGDARSYIKERLRETVDEVGDVDERDRQRWTAVALAFRGALDAHDGTWSEQEARTAWYHACCENRVDDPPTCDGWSSSALWAWHALVNFVRLHQAPTQGELAAINLAAAYHPKEVSWP